MKNVIVFALDQRLLAVELRWVREMFTLGYVTPIPSAPSLIDGVANLRGAITPIIDLNSVLDEQQAAQEAVPEAGNGSVMPTARRGDGAVLLEVESLVAAFRVSNVEEVSTLSEAPVTDANGPVVLIDSRGRDVQLIDPRQIIARALSACDDARGLQSGPGGGAHVQ